MTDNAIHLRSQSQSLIGGGDDEEYVEEFISDNNTLKHTEKLQKYVGINKYYVFFILRLINPFTNIKLIEYGQSNVINLEYSKDQKLYNTIYIFFHSLTNEVVHIIHICSPSYR